MTSIRIATWTRAGPLVLVALFASLRVAGGEESASGAGDSVTLVLTSGESNRPLTEHVILLERDDDERDLAKHDVKPGVPIVLHEKATRFIVYARDHELAYLPRTALDRPIRMSPAQNVATVRFEYKGSTAFREYVGRNCDALLMSPYKSPEGWDKASLADEWQPVGDEFEVRWRSGLMPIVGIWTKLPAVPLAFSSTRLDPKPNAEYVVTVEAPRELAAPSGARAPLRGGVPPNECGWVFSDSLRIGLLPPERVDSLLGFTQDYYEIRPDDYVTAAPDDRNLISHVPAHAYFIMPDRRFWYSYLSASALEFDPAPEPDRIAVDLVVPEELAGPHGGHLVPGRLGTLTLGRVRGAFGTLSPVVAVPSGESSLKQVPRAEVYTLVTPDRGIAYLQHDEESGRLRGSFEPGSIRVRVTDAVRIRVRYTALDYPVGTGIVAVGYFTPPTEVELEVVGSEFVIPGLPAANYRVSGKLTRWRAGADEPDDLKFSKQIRVADGEVSLTIP